MEIHLCKPGGQREGPYSLEQINADLAVRKYTGSDYWAWHQGLPEWVPLYSVSGVLDRPAAAPLPAEPKPQAAEPVAAEPKPQTAEPILAEPKPQTIETLSAEPKPQLVGPLTAPEVTAMDASEKAVEAVATEETGKATEALESENLTSDMPFAAMDHSFLLTSGDGPEALRSEVMQVMLQRIIGEDFEVIRQKVPRDVISRCSVLEELKGQSSTPAVIWKKMAALRPELLQQAREGTYRICVRSFRIENGDTVSLFLFYNKQKLQAE